MSASVKTFKISESDFQILSDFFNYQDGGGKKGMIKHVPSAFIGVINRHSKKGGFLRRFDNKTKGGRPVAGKVELLFDFSQVQSTGRRNPVRRNKVQVELPRKLNYSETFSLMEKAVTLIHGQVHEYLASSEGHVKLNNKVIRLESAAREALFTVNEEEAKSLAVAARKEMEHAKELVFQKIIKILRETEGLDKEILRLFPYEFPGGDSE